MSDVKEKYVSKGQENEIEKKRINAICRRIFFDVLEERERISLSMDRTERMFRRRKNFKHTAEFTDCEVLNSAMKSRCITSRTRKKYARLTCTLEHSLPISNEKKKS